ncbi:MAG: RES family NAD+ phosphorylase [Rhodoglobus sp.]
MNLTGEPVPEVHRDESPLVSVHGLFFRAVDPDYTGEALSGSRSAGRYSAAGVPTLYLSSSPEGVAAAMIEHTTERAHALQVLPFGVSATHIADLRDDEAMARIGVSPETAFGDWQQEMRSGSTPSSWRVRRQLEDAGAVGLIDPSRTQSGLWHLALFRWNAPSAPSVLIAPRETRTAGSHPGTVE